MRNPLHLLAVFLCAGLAADEPDPPLVVTITDAAKVTPPFVLRQDPTAAGGQAVFLPEGAGSKKLEGKASMSFQVKKREVYHGWVHARWRDSCGNSVTLGVDDRPGYRAGQDKIYRTWHWVRAGRHQLAEGAHTATIGEREDGIAVDQILFTTDKDFIPSGTIAGKGKERRRFRDDFARSPGHGMEAWDLVSGKWEITFSFDPNQIPNQYSLHGKPDGGEAIAIVKGPPWKDFRLSFSLFPLETGRFGAVLDAAEGAKERIAAELELTDAGGKCRVKGRGFDLKGDLASALRPKQWHRVTIEKLSGKIRLILDERVVLEGNRRKDTGGGVGLFVTSGTADFDDLELEQVRDDSAAGPEIPYVIGPYHFTRRQIEHPSEYLDFTEQEYRTMNRSPDSPKLKRARRFRPLVGRSEDMSPWIRRHGSWNVLDGALTGTGPKAVLFHSQEIASESLTLTMRFRLNEAGSVAEIWLRSIPGTGPVVRLYSGEAAAPREGTLDLAPVSDRGWHGLSIALDPGGLRAAIDNGEPRKLDVKDSDGQTVQLRVSEGSASFDDIEFAIPRRTDGGLVYVFDRRETDWWRDGGTWVDHGGIACILASSWISLVTPEGRGLMWNKRALGPDVTVSFNVEENSEWFGRNAHPEHVHHPYDNICVVLSPERDADRGYRLELNTRKRSKTVLYRNGEPVREVAQDRKFPMRYVGGHAPYKPRRSRITLKKSGGTVTAIVNGTEIMRYEDRDPLDVKALAIGGFDTRLNFSQVEVRAPLTPSASTSPSADRRRYPRRAE